MPQEWTNKGPEKEQRPKRSWSEHTPRMATCDPRFAYNVLRGRMWRILAVHVCLDATRRLASGYI